MHALHHPDRRTVLLVTALAAALAIVVSLVMATSLRGVNSGPASAVSRTSTTLRQSLTRTSHPSNLLAGNALISPLGAPIRLPWRSADPFAPTSR